MIQRAIILISRFQHASHEDAGAHCVSVLEPLTLPAEPDAEVRCHADGEVVLWRRDGKTEIARCRIQEAIGLFLELDGGRIGEVVSRTVVWHGDRWCARWLAKTDTAGVKFVEAHQHVGFGWQFAREMSGTVRRGLYERIDAELARAYTKHSASAWSRHEFYAVLKEEVDELWDAIKQDLSLTELDKEAIQVAAMVIRYLETRKDDPSHTRAAVA